MKLLHLPNDPSHNDLATRQSGPRDAFERLYGEGVLSGFETYLFLAELRSGRDAAEIRSEIIARAKVFKPDIVFWHHISEFPVDKAFLDTLRDASGGTFLAYHEGDPFDRFRKPLTPSTRVILANADIVFSVALGKLARLFREAGAKDLRYLSHVYDKARFEEPWDYPERRGSKVTMIASPWLRWHLRLMVPGVSERIRLARTMDSVYGDNFALYGRNWKGMKSWRGLLPFDQQVSALRDSWVSVNWDHFDDFAFYYSDRLPISLIAGVPHVTSYHPGYEDGLAGCPGLYTARTVDEAVAKVDWILSHTRKELVDIGRAACEWTRLNLDADVVFRRAIEICKEKMQR